MATDIHLKDQSVVVQGHSMRVEGEDLELRSTIRLPAAAKQANALRRALVHGEGDQLIVNFARDYTHTEVHGPVHIKTRAVPAALRLYASTEKEITHISSGVLRVANDLLLPIETKNVDEVSDLDAYKDSVGHTLRWILQRLTAIEQKLGVTPPPRPAADPRNRG